MSKHIIYKGQKYVRVDDAYFERELRQSYGYLADIERSVKVIHNLLAEKENLARRGNKEAGEAIHGCSEAIKKAARAMTEAYGWK